MIKKNTSKKTKLAFPSSLPCFLLFNCQQLSLVYGWVVRGQGRHSTLRGWESCMWCGLKAEHDGEETARHPRQKRGVKQRTEKEGTLVWKAENEREKDGVGGTGDQMRSKTSGLGPGSRDRGLMSWQEGGLWNIVVSVASQGCVGAQPVQLK